MSNQLEIALKVGGVVVLAILVFLPSIIAHRRGVTAFRSISALNALILISGFNIPFWMGFAWIASAVWVVAAVWAFIGKGQNAGPSRLTAIEQALFHSGSAHWICAFELSPEALVLKLHPGGDPNLITHARFQRPTVVSRDDSYADDEERNLPWDIIGFDSERLPGARWRFCLHTNAVEYVFDSPWPQITKVR